MKKLLAAFAACALCVTANAQLTAVRNFGPNELAVGTPIEGIDGSWYGTLYGGGANSMGAIYQITNTGTYKILHSFSGSDGANPVAGLVFSKDGNFYGTTSAGGMNGTGTIFSISPMGSFRRIL